jgi:hypothetical protein
MTNETPDCADGSMDAVILCFGLTMRGGQQ